MEPNPYQSPQDSRDEPPIDNGLIRKPGILSWILVIAILPTPLVGGVVGLMFGLAIGFQFFEAPPARPISDLTETGWWVVFACGALGFAITGMVAGFTIWRVLNPVDPA